MKSFNNVSKNYFIPGSKGYPTDIAEIVNVPFSKNIHNNIPQKTEYQDIPQTIKKYEDNNSKIYDLIYDYNDNDNQDFETNITSYKKIKDIEDVLLNKFQDLNHLSYSIFGFDLPTVNFSDPNFNYYTSINFKTDSKLLRTNDNTKPSTAAGGFMFCFSIVFNQLEDTIILSAPSNNSAGDWYIGIKTNPLSDKLEFYINVYGDASSKFFPNARYTIETGKLFVVNLAYNGTSIYNNYDLYVNGQPCDYMTSGTNNPVVTDYLIGGTFNYLQSKITIGDLVYFNGCSFWGTKLSYHYYLINKYDKKNMYTINPPPLPNDLTTQNRLAAYYNFAI